MFPWPLDAGNFDVRPSVQGASNQRSVELLSKQITENVKNFFQSVLQVVVSSKQWKEVTMQKV